MRFKSSESGPYQIFAVSGVNTISFGIRASETVRSGLLGFAVERIDPAENERYFMSGFKVFRSVIPVPTPETFVSTGNHPIQSFVWDDFTAKLDREYEYLFYPIKGTPKNLDRSTPPIPIRIRTEPLFSNERHDIFFNRGAASSQGSANFSEASTNDNDENMLLIRGNQRVADIYFTEFNRLFNHYYFRAVRETLSRTGKTGGLEASVFLDETDEWLKKYQPGKLRTKRLQLFTQMSGTQDG